MRVSAGVGSCMPPRPPPPPRCRCACRNPNPATYSRACRAIMHPHPRAAQSVCRKPSAHQPQCSCSSDVYALRQAQATSRARLCGQPFRTDDIAQHGLSSACHAGRGVRHDLHPRGSGTATCALTLTRTADAAYQRRDIRTHSTQVTSPMLAVQTDVSPRLTCANEFHDLYRDGHTCIAKRTHRMVNLRYASIVLGSPGPRRRCWRTRCR